MGHHHRVSHFAGNTPLVRLNRLSELTGSEIPGKAAAGNTGIGLTLVGAAKGCPTKIVIVDDQSRLVSRQWLRDDLPLESVV